MRAAVDEISGEIVIDYTKIWIDTIYNNTGKEFGDTYGDCTGNLLVKTEDEHKSYRDSSFEHRQWRLILGKSLDKSTGQLQAKLKIKGNPSKILYGGKNYRNPPMVDFRNELSHLAQTLALPVEEIKLSIPYEASVTVAVPPGFVFSEDTIKARFKSFQGKIFKPIENKHGAFMGYKANNSHYAIKVYLPARKFGEPLNYLRVESSYNRVKTFKSRTGIETWADLISDRGMLQCYQVILSAWDDVIIHDQKLKRSKAYPNYLNDMIYKGRHVDFWNTEFPSTASDKTMKKRMNEYRSLCFSKGEGLHTKVKHWIENEAEKFRNLTTWLTSNYSEYNGKNNLIEDCLNKKNITQMDTTSGNIKKSKKRLVKEKRDKKEQQFKSFINSLRITLQNIKG